MPITKTQATVSIIAGIAALVGSGLAISSYMDKQPKDEQKQAKTYLADKHRSNEPMTPDEWQAYAQVADSEIKKNGGLTIQNVKEDGDILRAVDDLMKK